MDHNFGHHMGPVRQVHFVGIGGAGMGGIAEVLHNMGYQISGSDMQQNSMIKHLKKLGLHITIGHAAEHIKDADVVVISSAIKQENVEWQAATMRGIPVVRRAEMLAELMRFKKGIAIAGTHGKSTTTSLLASIFHEAGWDPTYIIGGLLNHSGSHAKLGSGEYLLAEADESDASFLHLSPVVAILTNIDIDHLENYQHNYQNLLNSFVDFICQLPFYGLVIACFDDAGVRQILPRLPRRTITYGLQSGADYQAHTVHYDGSFTHFQVAHNQVSNWLSVRLNMPGLHNVTNALASISLAHQLGISTDVINQALAGFQGIERRFELHGEIVIFDKKILLIDDYAHHPKEILSIIKAAQQSWPDRRIIVIFEPHRYSRTHALFEDFVNVLCLPDVLFLFDVYPAGESAIPAANARSLCRALRVKGREPIYVETRDELCSLLPTVIAEGDLLLVLGAGDIGSLVTHLKQFTCSNQH